MLSPQRAQRFSALLTGGKPAATVRALHVAPRLLVRDGVHAGAWLTLRGQRMRLGRGDDCDIVLTDDGVPDTAGDFVSTPRGWHFQRAVEAEHAAGDAQQSAPAETAAANGPIVAPESDTLHARFRRRRWLLHGVTLVVIDIAALPGSTNAESAARLKHFALAAGATVFVAGSLLVLAFLVAPSLESKVVQARESLSAAGFRDVTLRRGEGRQIVLVGYVDDAAALARLRAWTQGIEHLDVKLQVKSGQELAGRVRESLADADGIKVSYQGLGRVRVEGSTDSAEIKARVHALAGEMKATAGIEDRVALVEPRQARNKPMPVRVVSVMLGATPYFETETGAIYIQGSTVPDGSEVVSIQPTRIFFRHGDRTIVYRLDGAEPLAKP